MYKVNKVLLMILLSVIFSVKIVLAQDLKLSANSENISEQKVYQTAAPSEFSLSQNYQQPFTIIKFRVTKQENVKLIIVNEPGKEVITIFNKQFIPGAYQIKLDATDLGPEVYFCKISTPSFSETQKLLLINK